MKRLGNSFKGIFGGIVLIIIGIGLLWWNEGDSVKNIKAVAETRKEMIQITNDTINPNNEGKLVSTNGELKVIDSVVNDSVFNVSIATAKLTRTVEIFQWQEESKEDNNGKRTYSYTKVWSDTLIDSSKFNDQNHSNPSTKPFASEAFLANNVQLGAFRLSNSQKNMLPTQNVIDLSSQTENTVGYNKFGDYYTTSTDLNNPQIGDVRVSFHYNTSTEISILARQISDTFEDYTTKSGKTFNRVVDGIHSGDEIINMIEAENNLLKWILRGVGTLLIILGIGAVFGPIRTLASFVPILGSLVGAAVSIVALLLGLSISLIIIALAWIVYRPLIGIGLLVIVGGLLFMLNKLRNKKKAENNILSNNQTPFNSTQAIPQIPNPAKPVNPDSNTNNNNQQ